MTIDPKTGLPIDDSGNILDATAAGSNVISESDPEALPLQGPPQASTPFGHPAASIPMPGEAAQPQRPVASQSYQGISQPQLKTVTKLQSGADKRAAADIAQFEPQYQEQAAAAENVAREHKAALQQEVDATREHAQRETELFKAQADFIKEQQDLERHAYAQSQIVRQQYMANYEHELLNAKMLAMSSGDPNERMGPGAAAGLIAAEAVQGFLKVGGINIDVNGQVDRFINREIAKHQQMVANAQDAAQGQLHLYNLARQNAQDDYEARERYRGFVLEGLKTQIGAEASRFGSQLAMATAAQKAAEVDAQLLGVKQQLADRRQALYFQAENMRITQAHQMAQDSIAREQLAWQKDPNNPANLKNKPTGTVKIADPGATVRDPKTKKVTGVKELWAIRNDVKVPDWAEKDIHDKQVGYGQVMASIADLRKLRAPAMEVYKKRFGSDWASKYDEDYRLYKEQVMNVIRDPRHEAAGANLTGQEAAEWKSVLEPDGWLSGSNLAKLSLFEKHYRTRFKAEMDHNDYVRPLDPSEQTIRPISNEGNDTDAAANAELFGQGSKSGVVEMASADVTGVGRKNVDTAGGASPAFRQFVKETGDKSGVGYGSNREHKIGQRHDIDAIDYLAAIVVKPEVGVAASPTVEGEPTVDAETMKQDAYDRLRQLAKGGDGIGKTDPAAQKYAQWMVKRLDAAHGEDPNDPWSSAAETDKLLAKLYDDVSRKTWVSGPDDTDTDLETKHVPTQEQAGFNQRLGINPASEQKRPADTSFSINKLVGR